MGPDRSARGLYDADSIDARDEIDGIAIVRVALRNARAKRLEACVEQRRVKVERALGFDVIGRLYERQSLVLSPPELRKSTKRRPVLHPLATQAGVIVVDRDRCSASPANDFERFSGSTMLAGTRRDCARRVQSPPFAVDGGVAAEHLERAASRSVRRENGGDRLLLIVRQRERLHN